MLLTCPTCRSGLQVPDGTTAHVRCPGCGTVFPADAGAAEAVPVELPPPPPPPPRPAPPPAPRPADRPRRPAPPRDADDRPRRRPEDDDTAGRPRGRRSADEDEGADRPAKRRARREDEDDAAAAAEKRVLKQAFARAAWGCRLVHMSFVFYALSLLLIMTYFVRLSLGGSMPGLIVAAGVLGLVNWVLGAVGIGLCLSGPPSPGHYRYGIGAAVAVGVHLVFLLALVNRADLPPAYRADPEIEAVRWAQLPTRLDSLTFYLTLAAYSEQLSLPRADVALPLTAGVVEMVRVVLILMALSCLARAAGEEELSHRCTRAAGVASFGPGAMAVVTLVVAGLIVETNAEAMAFARILFAVLLMGIYAVLAGMLVPGLMAARDTTEACEFPFQGDEDRLGG